MRSALLDRLLDARRGAHRDEDGVQPLAALASALQVDAGAAAGGLSDSRFSSEERTMVSGVRISCASLPASVRR